MFLRKILGRFLTTAPEKQELSSQQPLQVSTEPGQQLELIPATPSIQPHPQQMILPPCDMWWIAYPSTKKASTTRSIPSTIPPSFLHFLKFFFSIPKSGDTPHTYELHLIQIRLFPTEQRIQWSPPTSCKFSSSHQENPPGRLSTKVLSDQGFFYWKDEWESPTSSWNSPPLNNNFYVITW